jgi:hypothetical protein
LSQCIRECFAISLTKINVTEIVLWLTHSLSTLSTLSYSLSTLSLSPSSSSSLSLSLLPPSLPPSLLSMGLNGFPGARVRRKITDYASIFQRKFTNYASIFQRLRVIYLHPADLLKRYHKLNMGGLVSHNESRRDVVSHSDSRRDLDSAHAKLYAQLCSVLGMKRSWSTRNEIKELVVFNMRDSGLSSVYMYDPTRRTWSLEVPDILPDNFRTWVDLPNVRPPHDALEDESSS